MNVQKLNETFRFFKSIGQNFSSNTNREYIFFLCTCIVCDPDINLKKNGPKFSYWRSNSIRIFLRRFFFANSKIFRLHATLDYLQKTLGDVFCAFIVITDKQISNTLNRAHLYVQYPPSPIIQPQPPLTIPVFYPTPPPTVHQIFQKLCKICKKTLGDVFCLL